MDLTIEGKAYINGNFQDCCLGITNGKISTIKKILKGDKHYNFGNRLVLPAGIDVHVHFREPGFTHKEDFSTGSMAAAFGGISCFFDMPNTIPQTTTLQTLSEKIISANKKSYIDFGIYAGITDGNINNIEVLSKKSSGFKFYLSETTNSLPFNVNNLKYTFQKLSSTNKTVLIHAENSNCIQAHKIHERNLTDHLRSRPNKCEEIAIKNIFESSKSINSRIHICHLSSCEGLELSKNHPQNISFGATPHHMLFTAENRTENQGLLKVNPPLRTNFDKVSIFEGIKYGYIDILESDHAPHTLEEKVVDFEKAPSGIPGVETTYPMFLALAKREMIHYQRLISAICENPAKLIRIPKGKIEVGMDADLIVVDIKNEKEIKADNLHSKCGWTPFEGHPAIFPDCLFVRGEKLIEGQEIQVGQGFGRFVGV